MIVETEDRTELRDLAALGDRLGLKRQTVLGVRVRGEGNPSSIQR